MPEEQKPLFEPGDQEAEWLKNAKRNHDAFLAAMQRIAEQGGSMDYEKEPGADAPQLSDH